jgi:hypothetical protein
MIRKWICVRFEKEGIHSYPAALTNPELKDVSFLGHPHRHIFKFRVAVEVNHNERDIEFILFKRELQGLFTEEPLQWDGLSCEALAEDIVTYVREHYPNRCVEVEVSEDGENSATVQYLRSA